jgi:hypothetical protein
MTAVRTLKATASASSTSMSSVTPFHLKHTAKSDRAGSGHGCPLAPRPSKPLPVAAAPPLLLYIPSTWCGACVWRARVCGVPLWLCL